MYIIAFVVLIFGIIKIFLICVANIKDVSSVIDSNITQNEIYNTLLILGIDGILEVICGVFILI